MPFEDGSFKVVHCSDLLAYIPDTGAALTEMKRVLKAGGILGCREIIMDLFMTHPDPGPRPAAQAYAVFADTLEADDGHPQMGKELAGHLDQSGFTDIQVSASFEMFTGPERLKLLYALGDQWFFTSDIQCQRSLYRVRLRSATVGDFTQPALLGLGQLNSVLACGHIRLHPRYKM